MTCNHKWIAIGTDRVCAKCGQKQSEVKEEKKKPRKKKVEEQDELQA